MTDESGSSLNRMLAILDLFTLERFEWTVEGLSEVTGYTSSSTYRYVRALGRAGLLARMPGGTYVVGAKIIELETLVKRVDPVVTAAMPELEALSRQTGCSCLLSSVYGDHLINVAHVQGAEPVDITYARGEPLPWFRGAPGIAVLAFMPASRVRKLFDKFGPADADAHQNAWADSRNKLKEARLAGFCVSQGELQTDLVGFGVPVMPEGEPIGSISLVCTRARAELLDKRAIGQLMVKHATALGKKISGHRSPAR
ncbi:MAG: helix-turn-helix domain-containing protein [Pseudomonadota bacterium]